MSGMRARRSLVRCCIWWILLLSRHVGRIVARPSRCVSYAVEDSQ